jgi:hypothetical protein
VRARSQRDPSEFVLSMSENCPASRGLFVIEMKPNKIANQKTMSKEKNNLAETSVIKPFVSQRSAQFIEHGSRQ